MPVPVQAQFAPPSDDPLRAATPPVDDVEARRARAAIEGRLFSGVAAQIKVGRYRVESKIGAGGMGVVYRAHDPELARDVALKLMNPDALGEQDAPRARGRLIREARAMARLAHPNVIHVYDVGSVEDGVFIAMELVAGRPLSTWCVEEGRTWREVLAAFIDAGRGLAAAHEAGIVHRDFKPENVLVGDDGRVRVGDFGLAGGPGSETGSHGFAPKAGSDAEVDQAPVAASLTQTGALLGTPKYMAPEQDLGLPATMRSDQFSFCVALFEGLFGAPPFAGDTVTEYRRNVRTENLQEPLRPPTLPAFVVTALRRGLSVEPADRHAHMPALLDVLGEALVDHVGIAGARKRRLALWSVGIVAGLAVAAIAGWNLARRTPTPDNAVAMRSDSASAQPGEAAAPAATPTPATSGPEHAPPEQPVPLPARVETSAAETGPPPQPDAPGLEPVAEAKPQDEARTTARNPTHRPRARAGEVCHFAEDELTFLRASKGLQQTFTQGSQCQVCRKAPQHDVDRIVPPSGTECRAFYVCASKESSACG